MAGSRKPTHSEQHPLGGEVRFYALSNGMLVSVLGPDYPNHDDYELHERETDGTDNVKPGTERRVATESELWPLLDELESADA